MRTFSALVLATVLGFASVAHAVPDLTGTWQGQLACKGIGTSPFLFGGFNFVDKEATLAITQSGDVAVTVDETTGSLVATLRANDPDYPFALRADMCGPIVVNPANTKKARAGLVAGGPPVPGSAFAVDFSNVKVFPANAKGVTGKIVGKGVLIATGIGGTSAGCTWTFERIDEKPPADPPADCTVVMPN